MSHHNLVHKFLPMPQALKKYRMQRPQWIKSGKIFRQFQHGIWKKVKSKKEVILEAQREKKQVHIATVMDIRHLKKNAELEPKLQK